MQGGDSLGRRNRNDESDEQGEFQFRLRASNITQKIQDFKKKVTQYKAKIYSASASQSDMSIFASLEPLQKELGEIAFQIKGDLISLSNMKSKNPTDQSRRHAQFEKQSNAFSVHLREFQQCQKEVVNRGRAMSAASRQPTDAPADLMDFGNNQMQMQMQEQEQAVELIPYDQIENVHDRMQHLEADIIDINGLMKELNVMIHDQGEVIDAIESKVEVTNIVIESANTNLTKAKGYQAGSRRKMLLVILVAIIVAAVIGIIIYFKSKKK